MEHDEPERQQREQAECCSRLRAGERGERQEQGRDREAREIETGQREPDARVCQATCDAAASGQLSTPYHRPDSTWHVFADLACEVPGDDALAFLLRLGTDENEGP